MLRRGGKIRDSVKHGYGRADADGGGRRAEGALKKRRRRRNRMLMMLNLLVNCHLLRNASFGYFFF